MQTTVIKYVYDSVSVLFQTIRVGWEQLLTAIARNINEVENQVGSFVLIPSYRGFWKPLI